MLNRQIQVKISLLSLTGAANVKQMLLDAPDLINLWFHLWVILSLECHCALRMLPDCSSERGSFYFPPK